MFTSYPWDSVLQKSECETIARNIMIILKQTGDIFRDLKWGEYKKERLKDGGFTQSEKEYFDQAIPHCKSADTARNFSKVWEKSYNDNSEISSQSA